MEIQSFWSQSDTFILSSTFPSKGGELHYPLSVIDETQVLVYSGQVLYHWITFQSKGGRRYTGWKNEDEARHERTEESQFGVRLPKMYFSRSTKWGWLKSRMERTGLACGRRLEMKAGLAYDGLLMPSNGARALSGDHSGTFWADYIYYVHIFFEDESRTGDRI